MSKSLKSLIVGLYGIVGFSAGSKLKEVRESVLNADLHPWLEDITYLREALASVSKGKTFSMERLGVSLKSFVQEYKSTPDAHELTLTILRAFSMWMRSGNPGAWKVLQDNSHRSVFPSWISGMFAKKPSSKPQTTLREELEKVVQTLTGKRGEIIITDPELSKKLKAKYPEQFQEYLRLRRAFNQSWKESMQQFVLNSGKKIVPFTELEDYFEQNDIQTSLPTGFTGGIDAVGNIYSPDGERLTGGLPNKLMFPSVRMNDTGKGSWIFQAITPDGKGANYMYPESYVKNKSADKFDLVQELIPKLPAIRKRWIEGLKRFSMEEPPTVAAVELEILYTFSARIGTLGNTTAGGSTFGISTLLRKHLIFNDKGFILKYKGKDGVDTRHVLRATDPVSKLLLECMKKLAEGKKPSDPLFTYVKGRVQKRLPGNVVNRVFKMLGAGNATVHKLRTVRGTSLFIEECEALFTRKKSFDNISQAKEAFAQIGKKVGAELNHVRRGTDGSTKVSAATALHSYIDRAAQITFWKHYGMPLPAYLTKGEDIESSVLEADLLSEILDGEDYL